MAFGSQSWIEFRAMGPDFNRIALEIRPELSFCCTYEYLPIATIFQKDHRFQNSLYVQENYEAKPSG